LEFSASVGFIHKEFVTMHGHTIVKNNINMNILADAKIYAEGKYSLYSARRFFRAFSSVVRQMPRYTSQRRGTVHTLPN